MARPKKIVTPDVQMPEPTVIAAPEPQHIMTRGDGLSVYRITLPDARMGAKVFLLERKGV